jgi:hypothetical protein
MWPHTTLCLWTSGQSDCVNSTDTSQQKLTPRGWVVLVKLPVAQLLKNFPNILPKPNVHKSSPLVQILSQINPVHTTPSNFMLFWHQCLGLHNGRFHSGFPLKSNIHSSSTPCVLYDLPLFLLDLIVLITFGQETQQEDNKRRKIML